MENVSRSRSKYDGAIVMTMFGDDESKTDDSGIGEKGNRNEF